MLKDFGLVILGALLYGLFFNWKTLLAYINKWRNSDLDSDFILNVDLDQTDALFSLPPQAQEALDASLYRFGEVKKVDPIHATSLYSATHAGEEHLNAIEEEELYWRESW